MVGEVGCEMEQPEGEIEEGTKQRFVQVRDVVESRRMKGQRGLRRRCLVEREWRVWVTESGSG